MLASHAARGEQIVQAPPGGEDVATDRSWLEGGLAAVRFGDHGDVAFHRGTGNH
jgi:hypothetical protein